MPTNRFVSQLLVNMLRSPPSFHRAWYFRVRKPVIIFRDSTNPSPALGHVDCRLHAAAAKLQASLDVL